MLRELAQAGQLSSVLGVLSAMITPAVLILASGSLIMTTSSRLIRCIDRVRDMAEELEALSDSPTGIKSEKRELLYGQLKTNTWRARLLQRAMAILYVGISFFIGTSVSIGVIALLEVSLGWFPLILGFLGSAMLFAASLYLMFESRLALLTTTAEMDYITKNYMPRR